MESERYLGVLFGWSFLHRWGGIFNQVGGTDNSASYSAGGEASQAFKSFLYTQHDLICEGLLFLLEMCRE